MTNIISIATSVPAYCHQQENIIDFMSGFYGLDEQERRKLSYLYKHSGIDTRYSVIDDYSLPASDRSFIAMENEQALPPVEKRMEIYNNEAVTLSLNAIVKCLDGIIRKEDITHLITVSCTGMSAPGLDLQICEALQFAPSIFRTSINFMGCYAAIHALKIAKYICDSTPAAHVLIVDTELCTLHFQQEYTADNVASSLLFADGCAAVYISNENGKRSGKAVSLDDFFSRIAFRGKKDMAWQVHSNGFMMTLSGYVPQIIEEDIDSLVSESLDHYGVTKSEIAKWCIHPGGKRILDVIEKKLLLSQNDLEHSRNVLFRYGNMSSPTILFVLKEIMQSAAAGEKILGVAFGPGLTMETFLATTV